MPKLLVKKEALKLLQDLGAMDAREDLRTAPVYRTDRYCYYAKSDLADLANGVEVKGGIEKKYFLLPVHIIEEYYPELKKSLLERFIDSRVPVYRRADKEFIRFPYDDVISYVIKHS
nr:hypothetical protein [uncultured Pseudodesulfovibrio sp.]